MVTPGVLALECWQDITLIKAVARAFRWRLMLEAGRFGTINELAAAEKINSSYVSRVLRLTLLAPDIVEAILDADNGKADLAPAYRRIRCMRPGRAGRRGPISALLQGRYGFRASGVRTSASADRTETGALPLFSSSVLNQPSQEVRREP
ncbi:hypothetical protein AAFN86_00955 [Roseomonas sp. CAU 1739]|uniref:hypothetical protein n=1 Tax=Roseomonas sp. CAU 1739 TaxID=3140364 RepID=UPI00325A72FD